MEGEKKEKGSGMCVCVCEGDFYVCVTRNERGTSS